MMFWVSLIFFGIGFFLYWIWMESGKKGPVQDIRKRQKIGLEENTVVMESRPKEFPILFSAGSSNLEEQCVDLLREHFNSAILSQIGYIQLFGSADVSGNLSKNRRLVKERVQIVERYLVSLGIGKDKIQKIFLEPGYGSNPEMRKRLRSVQIQYK
ncbi:cell envelope biogenesis protein OmpA [Leptospira brenneri]|nr:cell envelope biogenesis protein OmpA [Leptospira brenneri]